MTFTAVSQTTVTVRRPSLTAPVLALTSATNNSLPTFTISAGYDLIEGWHLLLETSTNAQFSSPSITDHVVTFGEDGGSVINLGLTALADGTYWWRCRFYDGVNYSAYSNAVTETIATVVPYSPVGVTFNVNALAQITPNAALQGVVNGKSGLVSCWVKNANAAGATRTIYHQCNAYVNTVQWFGINGSGQLFYSGRGSGFVEELLLKSNTIFASMTSWKHALLSWNVATARGQLYVSDAPDLAANPTLINANMYYNQDEHALGAFFSSGINPLLAKISDLQIWFNVDVDISVQATRRLFIDVNGAAVDPALAATGIGRSADLLMAGSNWLVNKGSGGGTFVLQGAGTLTYGADNPP